MAGNSIDRRTFLLGSGTAASVAVLPKLSTAGEAVRQPDAPAVHAADASGKPVEVRREWKELYIYIPRASILPQ